MATRGDELGDTYRVYAARYRACHQVPFVWVGSIHLWWKKRRAPHLTSPSSLRCSFFSPIFATLSSLPKKHQQAKKAPASKKAAAAKAPLGESSAANVSSAAAGGGGGGKGGKSVEEIYQKKTQLEHILLRPDTYVGSCEKTEALTWVYDKARLRGCGWIPLFITTLLVCVVKTPADE